jgi:hypothetical protein
MKKREQEAGESDGPVAAAEQQGRHIIQKIRNRNLNNLFELRIKPSRGMFKARTADSRDSGAGEGAPKKNLIEKGINIW